LTGGARIFLAPGRRVPYSYATGLVAAIYGIVVGNKNIFFEGEEVNKICPNIFSLIQI